MILVRGVGGVTSPDRVLYGRKEEEVVDIGGDRITCDEASVGALPQPLLQRVKELCWGQATSIPRAAWLKVGLCFREAEGLSAYGLMAEKGATKGFQLVVQAYIMKHLMFEGRGRKPANR